MVMNGPELDNISGSTRLRFGFMAGAPDSTRFRFGASIRG